MTHFLPHLDFTFNLHDLGNNHCTITWDGKDTHPSNVVVLDLSSNGTFVSHPPIMMKDFCNVFPQINGEKVGKNRTGILREGNEIAFGTTVPQPANNGLEDYRKPGSNFQDRPFFIPLQR